MNIKKYSVLFSLIFIALIIVPSVTDANALVDFATGAIDGAISNVLNFFKGGLVLILTIPVKGLLEAVMQYQNFFSAGVNAGWEATRNFANLFFALILLFIAIATVLNIGALDNYTAKRVLPSFIFAALFINFSKAIVGFLIDISQIIMITFYNTFGPDLANVIANASKLSEGASTVGGAQISASVISLFNIIIVIILIFVFLWTTVILAMRIVTLWFVIILSPLAFISFIIPPLKSLGNSWSQQLQSALVTGPVLMFLLYLAFLLMSSAPFNGAPSGENLFSNGNLINYVLVIGLLVLANIEAQKAGNSAPGIVKSAVGVAGTVATFGLGAYVGAGGVGTGRMLGKGKELVQGGVKNVDKTIGGATRGAQVLSGGKINPNDRYEMWKKANKDNTEKGKAFANVPLVGAYLGSVAQQTLGGEAGRKEAFKSTQLKLAEEAKANGTLHQNPTLLRARNEALAKAADGLKGSSVPELIEQFKEETDTVEREAIFAKITELEGLKSLLADDKFKHYAEMFENESEQINALIADEFESTTTRDSQGNKIKTTRVNPTRSDRDFRSRIAKIGKDKKQGAYVSGIDNFQIVTDPQNNNEIKKDANGNAIYARTVPTNKPKEDAKKLSITEMGKALKTNRGSFQKRKSTTVNGITTYALKPDGTPDTELDFSMINNAILNSSEKLLEDPKTWASYDSTDIAEIKASIQQNIRQSPNRGVSDKYQAALKGIG